MTAYKFGDIVLVPFPFTDQTTTKKRPAVVVSSDVFNSQYADIIVMAITSKSATGTAVGEVAIVVCSNRPWRSLQAFLSSQAITTNLTNKLENMSVQIVIELPDSAFSALRTHPDIFVGEMRLAEELNRD